MKPPFNLPTDARHRGLALGLAPWQWAIDLWSTVDPTAALFAAQTRPNTRPGRRLWT